MPTCTPLVEYPRRTPALPIRAPIGATTTRSWNRLSKSTRVVGLRGGLFGNVPFQKVSVIKDNNVVYSTSGDRVMAFTWQDPATTKGKTSYYYVRGLQSDGQIVWVSPMWVTQQ